MMLHKTLLIGLVLVGSACSPQDPAAGLREALTFYAGFDGQTEAAFSLGDAVLYHAPSWDARARAASGLPDGEMVVMAQGEGRFGDALRFDHYEETIVFFRGAENIAYEDTNWSGTLSFWLRTDPDEDFRPGAWCDPILITPRSWDDAALFVDFSRNDTPRIFRIAAFADTPVWNPDSTNWWEISNDDMPWIQAKNPPFARDRWTHVAITFDRFNTGEADGVLVAYLNGAKVGDMAGRAQTFTWDSAETLIRLGMQYVGYLDDLAFFNRALAPEEVKTLYGLEEGVGSLLP